MKRMSTGLTSVCLLSLFSSCSFAHFDFRPGVSNGQIVTGGHDDETGEDVTSLRVGGYDFGEIPEDPYNIGDPGFNTLGGSAFAGGTTLRLGALPVGGAYLRYWDGAGDPTFTPAPAGVSLRLSRTDTLFATLTNSGVSYTPSTTASLFVGNFAINGALHEHLASSLIGPGGVAPVGAYLISFELTNPGTTVSASAPLYLVYNNGLSEETHDAAIDAVAASVPEPASLAGLAIGAGLLLRRR